MPTASRRRTAAKVRVHHDVLWATPLRDVFEAIDEAGTSDDPTEIVLAADRAIRLVEHGWRTGMVTLLGRSPYSDELEIIKPPNSTRPVLDRFGGAGGREPVIRISRNGRRETWSGIHIDDAGAAWLRRACAIDPERAPRLTDPATGAAHDPQRNTEQDCADWLVGLMERGPPVKNRGAYERDGLSMFDGITARGFRRAWDAAIALSGNADWRKSGPKQKISRSTKNSS